MQLQIFNSSGELIRTIRDYTKLPISNVKLDIKNTIELTDTANSIPISYGTGLTDRFYWDGKNENGLLVSNGTYEIQVTIKTNMGSVIEASKKVVILHKDIEFLNDLVIAPNPFPGGILPVINIGWGPTAQTGEILIRIYNIAGEQVKRKEARIEDLSFAWNMENEQSNKVSPGLYVIVVDAKNDEGFLNRKLQKLCIIQYR